MNARHRSRAKMNIPMCVACVLLCLTLFTTHLMSGLYARYTVQNSGGDGARVATFGELDLDETGDYAGKQWIITPGVNLTKNVDISFSGSEMACYLFVSVDAEGWTSGDSKNFTALSGKVSWTIAEGWKPLLKDGNQYVYYKLLEPNAVVNKADIIKDDTITVQSTLKNSEISAMGTLTLDFKGYAAQYDGTSEAMTEQEHAENAWDSVK